MRIAMLAGCVAALLGCIAPAVAQQPPFATTKVADNVYMFRYGGHQSMFATGKNAVLATDPIAYLRPQAADTYIEEIRKVSKAPIN
jgi:hypothetical protein